MHNDGYSTMCSHTILGLARVALDTGILQMEGDNVEINIDTPAGRVRAFDLARQLFQK